MDEQKKQMDTLQFMVVHNDYHRAAETGDWDEARRLNQVLYEDLFLCYQEFKSLGRITPSAAVRLDKMAHKLEVLAADGIWIEAQQNSRGQDEQN
jgi:hypothetical protein